MHLRVRILSSASPTHALRCGFCDKFLSPPPNLASPLNGYTYSGRSEIQ